MSLRRQASYNPTLTNYAQGHAQDLASALAEFVAPTVQVASAVGQFKQFDAKAGFQAYDTARGVGGRARRIDFGASDPTYNCQPQALEIAIDDAERDAAGEQMPALEEGKVRTLLAAATISHEDKVAGVMKTLAAVGSRGNWSDTSVDPIAELDEQIEAIATATGMLPNAIVFGLGAWRVFRNHPKVVAKQPGASLVGLTESQAGALFINPTAEVRVGVLAKDTAKFGAAASKTNLVGAEVFVFLRSANPTVYDPGWMKTFSAGEGSVTAVRTYRDERARSDILAIDWSEEIKITSSIAARRLTIS
jgi:hypothetical protein